MVKSDITQAVLNHDKLVRFCNEHGLILKVTDYHFQYIVATQEGNVGVISCHISNNGKYYAHKTGKKNECYNDFFAARPAFETFDKALEHVTRHTI